jgi:hypothetical protein
MLIIKLILCIIIWNLFIYQYYKIKQYYKLKKKLSDIKAISFAGAGYYITYYIGIYKGIKELFPNLKELKFIGYSAGSILCLLCILELDPKKELKKIITITKLQKNKNFIDKFFVKESIYNYVKQFNIYKKEIIKNKNRIKIGVSKFNSLKLIFEEYKYDLTECNLIDIILASGHIPFLTDNKFFKSNYTLDGVFSNRKLKFNNISINNTLYVGIKQTDDYDIAFETNNYYVNNLHMIFPPDTKNLIYLYKKGYNDIINYFSSQQ